MAVKKKFGEIDLFVSHSWRDPPQHKFRVLQQVRERFVAEHNREPVIWFDKVCIDQNNIESTLLCLPVYLSGCKKLLVICGPSYLDRLWCMMELFVFLEMHSGEGDDIDIKFIHADLDDGSERSEAEMVKFFEARFDAFDVSNAQCYDVAQREQLLGIIEAAFGGLAGFNKVLRGTMRQLRGRAMAEIKDQQRVLRASFSLSAAPIRRAEPDDDDGGAAAAPEPEMEILDIAD